MKKVGAVSLPLHSGKCPPWLFKRMKKLAGVISEAIIYDYGQEEYVRRISDPYFFQALGCALAFDWHSSGVTTTVCGALKEALNAEDHGIVVCGGKGRASRKTPEEIKNASELFSLSGNSPADLVYSSKMAAKVDNSCIQDGYQLYHHSFFLTEKGNWAIVQQGMGENYARRYHWLKDNVKEFVEEPHNGICCDKVEDIVLDMTSKDSRETRETSLDLVRDNPEHLRKYFLPSKQKQLTDFLDHKSTEFGMPAHHPVLEIDMTETGMKVLKNAYEIQPESYEELVALKGMGPKKIRALALISDLIYGTDPSWKDPVKYSFTHGGKDGFPYPVDKEAYDNSIQTLKDAVDAAKLDDKERYHAIKRLKEFL
ncbi:MAG: DUF763 domain-containing protein [Candidatus Hydrothermarchaeales archaeon]